MNKMMSDIIKKKPARDAEVEKITGECGRKEDLISFLYGEMTAVEGQDFSRHLRECASCRDEQAGFSRVREDLGAWETGWVPRAEWRGSRSRKEAVGSILLLFPAWARGLALTALAAGVLLAMMPLANRFGQRAPVADRAEIDNLVRQAVAREREQIENEYRARTAAFEQTARREQREQIEAVTTGYEARLRGLRASLRAEMRNSGSIRSYFALDDGYDLPGRGAGEER